MVWMEEVEGEFEEARRMNARLVSAAKEFAEFVDDGVMEVFEVDFVVKDVEIEVLKVSMCEFEYKFEDCDVLLVMIRGLEIEFVDSVTNVELMEFVAGKFNLFDLIIVLEVENKEMCVCIVVFFVDGGEFLVVMKKYEAAAFEVVIFKSRIRLFEV